AKRFYVPARQPRRERRYLRRCRDDGHRLRIAHDVPDLALPVEHVDRHDDHPELHAGDPEIDDLDAVHEAECEAVAALHAAIAQQLRDPVAARFEVAERQRGRAAAGAIDLDRRAIAAAGQRAVVEVNERQPDGAALHAFYDTRSPAELSGVPGRLP